MTYPQKFLSYSNFELAFKRIVKGSNKEYKLYYSHLFPGYNLALEDNLNDLIKEIRQGTYKPSTPNIVYLPKRTGTLRPLTLLSLTDLIVSS